MDAASESSSSSGHEGEAEVVFGGGQSSPGSSFVMSFHAGQGLADESPWTAPLPAAGAQAPSDGVDAEQEAEAEEEEERKLTPEEAALAEAEALRASTPTIAAALATAASVSSSTYSNAAVAVASASATASEASEEEGQGQQGSIGDDYRNITQQKARREERLQALLASKEHARRTFPRIRRVYTDHYLKIMVAGESGHGKTSFINNLFLSYTNGRDVKPHDGTRTRVEDFLADPDGLCTRFSVENESTLERMHYTIQDTPGYGDDTDIEKSINMVLDHVEACNARYLAMETDTTRTEAIGAQEDPRIDVCLYFVAAHRLKHIDLKFMRAIAARVALIPVIAKADSMTAEETVAFRREIMAECEKHSIPLFDFGTEAKAGVGIPPDLIVPPFAVVASNKFDEVRGAGSFWPVRDYHWGTCEAFSMQHSDCTYLKRLLLEEGFHDLRRATEQRYLEYRRDHFAKKQVAARAAAARRAQRARRWLLIGLATLAFVAGLGTLLVTPPPSAHGAVEPLAWGRRRGGPLAFLFGRWGGGSVGEGDEQVHALAARLQGKEAELAAAQQTIDLLVSSVRSLEASMSRLVGPHNSNEKERQQGAAGDGGGVAPPLFVRVEEDVSAKSLSEIDRLLQRLGFGGVLATELAAAEDPSSAAAVVPPSDADISSGDEEAHHRNASEPTEPPLTTTNTATAGARRAGGYPSYSTCPSSGSSSSGGERRRHRRAHQQQQQQRKRGGCGFGGLGKWLEGMARFHEEKFEEVWEQIMRWFL